MIITYILHFYTKSTQHLFYHIIGCAVIEQVIDSGLMDQKYEKGFLMSVICNVY